MIKYHAIALDLDGVVTDTQKLHYQAWKETFDSYLKDKKEQAPFNETDYEKKVDGLLRLEGVRSFLESRGIYPNEELIKELGDRKNQRYSELLNKQGPEVFADSVEAIKKWKNEGIPVAIVSSSKNTPLVLEKAGITELFESRVDGNIGEEMGLRGKPEGDYFVEAIKELGFDPSECAMVEDAEAGVKAGKSGGFKRVIGMDRSLNKIHSQGLRDNGADEVISSLLELRVN